MNKPNYVLLNNNKPATHATISYSFGNVEVGEIKYLDFCIDWYSVSEPIAIFKIRLK